MSFNHSQETGVKLVLFLNLLKKERKVGLKDEKILHVKHRGKKEKRHSAVAADFKEKSISMTEIDISNRSFKTFFC